MDKKKIYNIVMTSLVKMLNENLKTHDDEYNIYEKLDELDISYDYINVSENIIEIRTPDEETKSIVKRLLNYYGWKCIKETDWSICAERIYGDNWNNFYDEEAEKDDEDYPYGVGIYYHITTTNKVQKILKQGLTTREGNKLGYARGQRTYLLSYPGKEFAHYLFRDSKEKPLGITILLVDLREYLGKQINIYHDDFASDDGAVYTYDYIPPKCLSVYEEFEIDDINEAYQKKPLLESKTNLQTVPLSKEFINDNANEANWLNHLRLDADGIAYMDGKTLVGYIGYKGSWIIGIWVKPSYRKEHIGSKLMDYAVKHGAYRSSVNKQNIGSLNFHQKNGFIIYKFDTVMYYLKKETKK